MAGNYQDVLDQLQAAGLLVSELTIGRMTRTRVEGSRERKGWYSLHVIVTQDGTELIVGSFGIWSGNDNGARKVELKRQQLSDEQRDAIRRRMAEDRKRADDLRRAENDRAAGRAEAMWAKLSPTGESPYLAAKCVPGYGLRYTPSGTAVVPLLDNGGRVHGLQFLRTAAQAEQARRPAKEFWPSGLAKKGHYHLIGMPADLVLIAEGYATAASIHAATQLPVAVAFDAGNLQPVVQALRWRYKRVRVVVCADDDALGKCSECGGRVVRALDPVNCQHCGKPHRRFNAGVTAASTAALEGGDRGSYLVPVFANEQARRETFLTTGRKLTDFNDVHVTDGLHAVREQISTHLSAIGHTLGARDHDAETEPEGAGGKLKPIGSVDQLLRRFSLIYGNGGAVFDHQEHKIVSLSDMRDACLRRELHRAWMESSSRRMVRVQNVGFDPGGSDPQVTCNLWSGWPTTPSPGRCDKLLELLWHMCSRESESKELYWWVLRWLAYPIQYPGAKMKSTVVVHGPQGTGKNLFFESVMSIYGPYGRVIDQSAIEDKFNDWASGKLFLIADEVVARSDLYHVKNRLKAFITGEWIRINPKNLAARDERNHVNMVFLSNEAQPVVLEEDDRRHAVVWTPEKLDHNFYAAVKAEIQAGGIAALHQYLLELELGSFDEGTYPPDTDAKRELIDLSLDSTSAFYYAIQRGEVGKIDPQWPTLTTEAYAAYQAWCTVVGARPAPMKRLLNQLTRKHGCTTARKRYWASEFEPAAGPHAVLYWQRIDPDPGLSETVWLGNCIAAFRNALKDWRGGLRG